MSALAVHPVTGLLDGCHYGKWSHVHDGPRALCADPDCKPWPLSLDATTRPCPCWTGRCFIHGWHCCFRVSDVVCHAVPESLRHPQHCAVCGYPDTDGTERCGLCGTRLREISRNKTERRAQGYAAKWVAEHQRAEPPRGGEPTDDALAACFARCAGPASPDLYPLIRREIAAMAAEVATA